MTAGRRLVVAVAVLAAPLAWVTQLVFAYAFEDAACAPRDGTAVWGVGVTSLHVVVGVVAFVVAASGVAAALRLRADSRRRGDEGFLASFGLAGALVFAFTIVLTLVGSTVLATCHAG